MLTEISSAALGWSGELVRLVPRDKEKHFANTYRWANDSNITATLAAGFPTSKLELEERFERSLKASDTEVIFAIELLTGEHIGVTSIHGINWKNGSATTGTLIGARQHWGKGYATDAARVRTHYCFNVLGLRYLTSAVQEGNERSLRMLQKAGYLECGRYPKKLWNRGRYVDEILLYMTREMWTGQSDLRNPNP